MTWITTVALYNQNFARKRLVDSQGQPLTGVYEVDINSVWIKYLKTLSHPGLLCCNLFTNWELNSENVIEKVFQPLDILELQGSAGEEKVIPCNKSVPRTFHDVSEIQFWIDDFSRNKVTIEISVGFMYRRKLNV